MNRTITYGLRLDEEDSDTYHAEISAFATNWVRKTLPAFTDLVNGFRAERILLSLQNRPEASLLFDLLVLGVLLREHSKESSEIGKFGESILTYLVGLQEKWPKTEGFIKTLRGFIHRLAHLGKRNRRAGWYSIEALITWLQANGDDTQADRMAEWNSYFNTHGNVEEATKRVLQMADDFSTESMKVLGRYTAQVDEFLTREAPQHRWRYDATLLNHTRLEYHLGMLGNEILNTANRQGFLETKHKVVILPPCMRAQPEGKCKAAMTKFGERCASCTPSCRIHQVTKLGEKYNFEVYIIPDELRVFGGDGGKRDMGVIGVSCVLTNWTGGWDVEKLGIPAQGVLLDYVGCKYHWDRKGFPTDTNLNELIVRLGIKNDK